ncbi:hypothetical protein BDN67DRAFT_195370 [Paxillus ammoniavirescens]|nr:hypothetical protein BDN67DRAFT_195370 [Paxillus ammoniavirescens]
MADGLGGRRAMSRSEGFTIGCDSGPAHRDDLCLHWYTPFTPAVDLGGYSLYASRAGSHPLSLIRLHRDARLHAHSTVALGRLWALSEQLKTPVRRVTIKLGSLAICRLDSDCFMYPYFTQSAPVAFRSACPPKVFDRHLHVRTYRSGTAVRKPHDSESTT